MKKLFTLLSILAVLLAACQPAGRTVRLALLGDLMVGRGVHPGPDSLSYLASDLKGADLSLANLESPLAPGGATGAAGLLSNAGYNLCADSARAALFPAWGLDLLSLANNHRFDCGSSGVETTAQAVTALGLTPVGPGMQPVYREINGLHLAFFAFDDISAPLDVNAATQAIRAARASDRQKALARQFAEAGAALIVGTHPHVLQPAGWIPTAQGKTLVLYSLGNALFDQAGLPDTRQSALVLVTLDSHGVQSTRIVPFEIDTAGSRILPPAPQVAARIRLDLALP